MFDHLFRYAPDGQPTAGPSGDATAPGDKAAGETSTTEGKTPDPVAFDAWLKTQPEEVQAAYSAHLSGLTNTLATLKAEGKTLKADKLAREQAQAEAEKKRLEAEGKFKELAEQAQAKLSETEKQLTELAPLKEQSERYRKALETYAAKAKEGLPAHVVELLDALPDPVAQLDYLTKHGDALRAPAGFGGPAGSPGRSATTALSDEDRRKLAYHRTSL
jgi:DNA repair exonuclease SbcCD ATPase subunit